MKTSKQNTAQYHQEKIALKTLKMTPAMASIMGGMSYSEAEAFLQKIGYTEAEIQKAKN